MKTYEETIQYIADNIENGKIRYESFAAKLATAFIYGVDINTVYQDVQTEENFREEQKKKDRKLRHQAENEARRLANLAKK